jgi:uncharacterized protein YndB with AHSA1/START domain
VGRAKEEATRRNANLSRLSRPEPGRATWSGRCGIYRVDVEGHVARGEYVEVDPPRRVVFTWGWEEGAR